MSRIRANICALACVASLGLMLSSSSAQAPYEMMQQALIPAVFAKKALEAAVGAPLTCEPVTISQGQSDVDAAGRIAQFAQSKGWRKLSTQDVMGGRVIVYLRDPADKRKLALGSVGADSMYAIMSCQASAQVAPPTPNSSTAVKAPLKNIPNTVHGTAARVTATDFCKKYKCQAIRKTINPERYFPTNEEVVYRLNNGLTLRTNQALADGYLLTLQLFYSAKASAAVTAATVKDFAVLTFGKVAAANITPAGVAKCRNPRQENSLLWSRPYKPQSIYGDALKCYPDHLMSLRG